jgi:hypothetical protein
MVAIVTVEMMGRTPAHLASGATEIQFAVQGRAADISQRDTGVLTMVWAPVMLLPTQSGWTWALMQGLRLRLDP